MKNKLLCILLLTLILISGCAKENDVSNSQPLETTNVPTTIVETTAKPTVQETTKQNKPSIEDLYGYYLADEYFMKYDENECQLKLHESGFIVATLKILSVDCEPLDDGGISIKLQFDIEGYDYVSDLIINKDKEVFSSTGTIYTRISKEEYYSVEYTQPPTEAPSSTRSVWYEDVFETRTVQSDLTEITNLIAVGKFDEADQMIDERIYGKIETNVEKYINSREYWIAQNYIAMFNAYLSNNSNLYGVHFSDLSSYFRNNYGEWWFKNSLQPYYKKIALAAFNDTDFISKEQSKYVLNENLIDEGLSPVSGIYDDSFHYLYFNDILDNKFNITDYYIVCPFTQKVYYLPVNYFFLGDDGLYEPPLEEYKLSKK